MKRTLSLTVGEEYSGRLVKDVLKKKWDISSACLTELKKYNDGITVNGQNVFTVYRLNNGDRLEINIYDGNSDNIVPEDIPLDIIYEDEDILAVNKPPGMPTHPSQNHYTGTLANAVMGYYGGEFVFRAVNRLDASTSGLMLIAKNRHSHNILSKQIQAGIYHRTYLALAEGLLNKGSGIIDAPIARANDSSIKRIVKDDGKTAVTEYRVIEYWDNNTLAEVAPKTGRTHQIRVHMAHIGHPLVGDWLYGTEGGSFGRPALHSYRGVFRHPISGDILELTAPLPEDFKQFTGKLKKTDLF